MTSIEKIANAKKRINELERLIKCWDTSDEKDIVISEAQEILDVEDVIASIILVEDLRIQRE